MPSPEGAREHDRLEGRAGLALRLRGEVELALAEVGAADHRLHRTVARVDRDESGRRAVGVREHALDRLRRLLLQLQVDRGRHLEPTAEDAVGAELRDELILDVVDEVGREVTGAREAHVLRRRQRRAFAPGGARRA